MNFNYKNENIDVYPLFGDLLKGEPYVFDFSSKNPKTLEYNLNDFKEFNDDIFNELIIKYYGRSKIIFGKFF